VTVTTHDAARGFDVAADAYDRVRPDYPDDAVDLVARALGLGPGRRLLDLGAGTGRFSRVAALRGATVVAIEPSEAMVRLAAGVAGVLPVRAVAEALPVRRHGADGACAASAFHWFDGRRALGELHEALRRGGRLALLWNHRDDRVDWVARLSEIVNRHEGAAPRYRKGDWRAAFDHARDLFRPLEQARFRHVHALPPADVVERIASVSFIAVLPPADRREVLDEVRQLLASHPDVAGRDELPLAYLTDVFLWERV
jgi:SAM-dependent methyltransferase